MPWRALAAFFGLFIGYSAVKMLGARAVRASGTLPDGRGLFAAGAGVGLLSALLGAGGGFITVPYLARRGVTMQQAVACSAACGFPIALAGTLGYAWAGRHLPMPPGTVGYVYLPALVVISATSMITAPLGARAAHALQQGSLRRVFAGLLLALAVYMLGLAIRG